MIIHNVTDKRNNWIGSWEAEPLIVSMLTEADKGRTVIYQSGAQREAGTLTSWRHDMVWARFSQGATACGCHPRDLFIAVASLPL